MALFNEILAGRFNKQLLKLFNMKGQAPSPQVSGDLIGDVTLENDRPEWSFLKGEIPFIGTLFVGNGGAFQGRVRTRLSAKNVICVVTSVTSSHDSIASEDSLYVGGASYNIGLTDLVEVGVVPADSRFSLVAGSGWGQQFQVPLLMSAQNSDNNTAGTAVSKRGCPINQTVELLSRPLILCSSNLTTWPIGFDVRCGAANAAFSVTVMGYMRAAEEGELI